MRIVRIRDSYNKPNPYERNMKSATRPAPASRLSLPLLAATLAASASGLFAQNLLINPSFEDYISATNGPVGIAAGTPNSVMVPGWTIETGANTSVSIANFATVSDGLVYFAFNVGDTASSVASIYQDIATTPGATYLVSFDVGRFGPGAGSVDCLGRAFDVVAGATDGGYLGADLKGSAVANAGAFANFFASETFSFTAVGTTSRILINDVAAATASVDLIVDNASVTLTAIPEPSSYAAIAGAALLGFAAFKRRNQVKAVVA